MGEAKLSSKNQIVVPREAREALKLKAGDKLLVVRVTPLFYFASPRITRRQTLEWLKAFIPPITCSKEGKTGTPIFEGRGLLRRVLGLS
jgi:AbrB family looped-hinge helix DNA binding protein